MIDHGLKPVWSLSVWLKINQNWRTQVHCSCILTILFSKNCRISIFLACDLERVSTDRVDVAGTLTIQDKVFAISGTANMIENVPVRGQLQLDPRGGMQPLNFQYRLQPRAAGYALQAKVEYAPDFAEMEAQTSVRSKFDWDMHLQVRSPASSAGPSLISALGKH